MILVEIQITHLFRTRKSDSLRIRQPILFQILIYVKVKVIKKAEFYAEFPDYRGEKVENVSTETKLLTFDLVEVVLIG